MLRFFGVVAVATAISVTTVSAQSALELSGPAELPPASFKGQQYIDSRGCAFLRAGYGGQVTWVPRVTRDRKQICGGAPSGGAVEVAEEAAAAPAPTAVAAAPVARKPTPAPAPTIMAGKPVETVASITTPPKIREAAPAGAARVPVEAYTPGRVVVAAVSASPPAAPAALRPQTVTEAAAVVAPSASGQRLVCPAETPVAQRFAVHGGGTKLLCVKGDGSMTGANFPRLASGGKLVATRADGTRVTVIEAPAQSTKSAKMPPMPEGYVSAWDDDRLNINRGRRTAAGEIAQDEIWTRTVPAELREDSKVKRKNLVIIVRPSSKGEAEVAASTKSAPAKAAGYVQVGTFSQPANADKAAARLAALGLPVARSKVKRDGKLMQIVLAGPFGTASEAKAALSAARGAGFGDAILR